MEEIKWMWLTSLVNAMKEMWTEHWLIVLFIAVGLVTLGVGRLMVMYRSKK